MKPHSLLVLAFALLGSTVALFWVTALETQTIYPLMDSYSWESVPDANNGGSNNFEITSSTANPRNMRGWILFSTESIPPDVWIVNAEFRLRIWHKTTEEPSKGLGDSTGRIYGVYRLTQAWSEYNVTWTNQPSYTQVHAASAAVPPGQGGWEGPVLWMRWDVTEIVRDWMSGAPNFGVLVRDTQEYAPLLYSTQFFTHDKVPSQEYYPALTVTYVSHTALAVFALATFLEVVLIIILSRLKSVYRKGT